MTGIVLQRSKDPCTCMCCGRMAIGLGVYEKPSPIVAWVCNDRACSDVTRILVTMKSNELIALEQRACEAAAQCVAEPILNEVMSTVWDAGIRDLSTADPEQVSAAISSLASGQLTALIQQALISFGASVKQQLKDGECPF